MTRAATPNRPTVSVIVPCFNYGHFLEGCLASVLSQELVDVRVLVIDDRSTDASAEVARRLAAGDDRVEFREHRENVGLIPTANEGLEWAQGEYVVLLSADDFLVPGSLARAASVMDSHPNVGMVYGRPLIARENQPIPTPSGRWRGTRIWPGAKWIRLRCRSGHSCISSPEAVVRSSVQRSVGGYDPVCFHSSDVNMWLRIAAVSDIAYVRGTPQAIYRVHANSMARSQSPLVELRERRAAYDSFFARCSSALEDPERLRTMVSRTFARQALWKASRAVDRGLGEELVAELTAFALEVYPNTGQLREWHGLRLRKRIGAGRSLVFLPFIATGVAHRLQLHAARTRWRFRGV
ncbi:MAG TPA: glycosyltransferase [Solirubrobacteraceae bacterium]|nr:glycosyltransferase [Solirubrobacteraceae bacterium]